jgi:FlaA1/EpsC-like NDP-sugar epimerase
MFVKSHLVIMAKLALDLTVLGAAYCLAFWTRFEGKIPPRDLDTLVMSLPYVLLIKFVFLASFNVPSWTWRHAGLCEARHLSIALSVPSALLLALRLAPPFSGSMLSWGGFNYIPLGVILIDIPLSLLGTLALRASVRWRARHWHPGLPLPPRLRKIRTLLIGAGSAGALVAEEIETRSELGIQSVGFLDDNPNKTGKIIHGVRVLGTTASLQRVVQENSVQQALITFGSPSGPHVRRIIQLCEKCRIPVKIIPGIQEMVEGKVDLSAIREVAVEDVLHRESVSPDNAALAELMREQTILVTGAGGSIGSELCQQLCRLSPATLLLVEQAENNLFQVHRQLSRAFPRAKLVPCIADICDSARMERIFCSWKPDAVLHAAAHKHVPLMEWNAGESIKNNVGGTRSLADLAARSGIPRFVMISTDKAVNPTSIMGASKRIAEIYIQALSQRSATRFVTVRFGNVLGSAGSVIPIFKEQIARGGPVTITHPEMKRYFMTIPEACQLVLQAACLGCGGEIFILDMGEPVKIVELASDLIRLSGFSPDEIPIEFIGLRPGEKLFEELALDRESVQRTRHPKIFIGRHIPQAWETIDRHIRELIELANGGDAAAIYAKVKEIVPEYQPPDSFPASLESGLQLVPSHEFSAWERNGSGLKNNSANGHGATISKNNSANGHGAVISWTDPEPPVTAQLRDPNHPSRVTEQ